MRERETRREGGRERVRERKEMMMMATFSAVARN